MDAPSLRELTPDEPVRNGRTGKLRAVQGGVDEHPQAPVSDEDLLEAFYDGADAALDCLMTRYQWLLYWVISRLPHEGGGRPQRAEDIVQRAWLKVMESKGRAPWRRVHGLVRPWLLTLVANCLVDELRKKRGEPGVTWAPAEAADPAQEDLFVRCELRAAVAEGLGSLEPLESLVVVLMFWDGMRQNRIAAELGVAPATICRCWARAREKMRESLAGAGWEED